MTKLSRFTATQSAPPITVTEAIHEVKTWTDQSPQRRKDLCSALNTVARLQGAPPDDVLLTAETLRASLMAVSPAEAGTGKDRLANIRSALRFVLRRLDRLDDNAPLTPEWQGLLGPLDYRQRAAVTALAHYCSAKGMLPIQVGTEMFAGFIDWLVQRTLTANPAKLAGATRRAWNRFAATVPGWPSQVIESARDPRQGILPLDAFPQSFRDDVAAFEAWLQQSSFERKRTAAAGDTAAVGPAPNGTATTASAPTPAASETRGRALTTTSWKPLRASSAANRAAHARWAASVLVTTGVPIEQITCVRDLVQPLANAEIILMELYRRADNGPSARGTHIADVLRIIARHFIHAPPDDVARIAELGKPVRLQYAGLTQKNETAIARALRPGADLKLRELPDVLMRAARQQLQVAPRRAVSLALRAAALVFLLYRPLRLANIIGLHLDRHLQRDDPRRPDVHRLQIQAAETKTNHPITLPVPPAVNRLLQHWITVFRPLIAPPGNRYLFPGGGKPDGHITPQGFRDAVRTAVHQGIGVKLTPHQYRHLAGKRYLAAHPGEYETVRQFLGHKRLETTINHYIGTQAEESAARFDEVVTGGIAPKPKRGRPRKQPSKPSGAPRKPGTPGKTPPGKAR